MEENQIVNSSAEQAGTNAEGQEQVQGAAQQPQETATATTNEPATASANADTANQTSNVKIQEPVAETVAAHDDFDWSIDKRNVTAYTQDQKEKYDKVYENTFVQLNDGEM